jgi:hypothetical protein
MVEPQSFRIDAKQINKLRTVIALYFHGGDILTEIDPLLAKLPKLDWDDQYGCWRER